MIKLIFRIVIILILPVLFYPQSVKSKNNTLIANRLPDGNYVLENNKIKIIIAPKFGGRIISLMSKDNQEEVLQSFNVSNTSAGGALYDIFGRQDWPGTANNNYNVKNVSLTKNEDILSFEMNYSLGDSLKEKNGLIINKKIYLDDFSSAVHTTIEIQNNSSTSISFQYKNASKIALGAAEEGVKIIWVPLEKDIAEIGFSPMSGSHGGRMYPTGGFIGLTAKDTKTAAIWVFDPQLIDSFDTFHSKDAASLELSFQNISLEPKKSVIYEMDIVLMSDMKNISGADLKNKVIGGLDYQIKNNRILLDGSLYTYSKEALSNLKLVVSIYDMLGGLIQTVKEETIENIIPDNPYKYSGVIDSIGKLKAPVCKAVIKLIDPQGVEIFYSEKKIKIGDLVPDFKNPVTVNFMWVLNQPLYPKPEDCIKNLGNYNQIYSNIFAIYEKHPLVKSDIAVSGALLYQMIQFYPDLIEKLKYLIGTRKNLNLMITGFSHPLFPFISSNSISMQIKLDKELKSLLFGVKPDGIYFPELAYKDGVFDILLKNEITWGYFSDASIKDYYKNMTDIDYFAPSRVISSGFGMNCLIRDQDAPYILMKQTEQSIDEFIQYLVKLQEKNKEGKRVLVVAQKGEFFGTSDYMDRLFTRLERIKWVKIMSGSDIFKAVIPTQTFLGEKITGGWFVDEDSKAASYKPWIETENKKQVLADLNDVEDSVFRNGEKIDTARGYYQELDFSMPVNIYEECREKLIFAEQSDWFYGNNVKGLSIVTNQLDNTRKLISTVYDNLMSVVKKQKINVPLIKDKGIKLNDEEKDRILSKIPAGKFQIWEKTVEPAKLTYASSINIKFRIFDKNNGIDYNNVYIIVNYNDSDDYYKVNAKMMFNGSMMGNIGGGRTGDEGKFYIYAKDRKGNEALSDKFTFVIEP